MDSDYDENLGENYFFKQIRDVHGDILKKASENNWIICIPRSGSVTNDKVSKSIILEHVLYKSVDSSYYYTLSHKEVKKQNNILTLNIDNIVSTVRILFVEEFYVGKDKFIIWCLERPLNCECDISIDDIVEINNLRDCVIFLWMDNLGCDILEKINHNVQIFLLQNNLSDLKLHQLTIFVEMLYNNCLGFAINNDYFSNKINNQNVLINIRLSVEAYMQTCLSSHIFNSVSREVCYEDSNLNKIIRNIQDVPLKFFNIRQQFYSSLPLAKSELNKINRTNITLEKINCLKRVFEILSIQGIEQDLLTTDNLLEIFVFLIIKCNVYNWISNLVFIKKFRFSVKNSFNQNNFLIATLQAAVEYIQNNDLISKYTEFEIKSASLNTIDGSHNLNTFFQYIQTGNLEKVVEILNGRTSDSNIKLCHPLCSCDKCEKLLKETNNCTVNSSDDKGQTPLHIACKYGKWDVVDFFLHNGANLNSTDCSGYTPLHYAVLRGYQHVALLVFKGGCNVNEIDCEGNTPLHIATKNGHNNCVKALIYLQSDFICLDCKNNSGDTPLHFASKFGYVDLVSILIQHGARVTRNKRNLTPIDIALNECVRKILSFAKTEEDSLTEHIKSKRNVLVNNSLSSNSEKVTVNEIYRKTSKNKIRDSTKRSVSFNFEHEFRNQRSFMNFGVRSKDLTQVKKIDLLLKAVENDDLQLTCFYLGIPSPNVNVHFQSTCHPLCTCEKCTSDISEDVKEQKDFLKEHLNINICNKEGFTPIHFAANYGRIEILRILLDTGALINLRTYKTFYTPLHLACLRGHSKIVKELLKCGNCKIDVPDSKGNTPLHYACLNNDTRTFELLLSNGANETVQNNDGKTVLGLAEDNMFVNIVKILTGGSNMKKHFDICDFDSV